MLLFLTANIVLYAQQPSHFIIGQQELSDVDIYHTIQDKEQNYWLATNRGIIKFDGYTFKTIKSKEMLSSSAFDLQMDYNNNIHFKNLSGQIFKIENDSCILRIQVPDSLMSSLLYYTFDNDNNIFIATNTVFKVTPNNKITFYKDYNPSLKGYTQPIILKDSSILIHNHAANEIHLIKDDNIKSSSLNSIVKNLYIQSFYLNNKLYYYDRLTGKVVSKIENFTNNDSCFIPLKNNNEYLRFYSDNDNLWVARQGGGVNLFKKDFSAWFNNNTIFNNSIISSFLKDKEGNILLGTFGEGLIVITNLELKEINLPHDNAKITRITSTPNNEVYLGTQNGRIYKIDSTHNINLFRDKEFKNIEVLEYIEETNELLVNEKIPTFINLSNGKVTKQKFGAIKDVVHIEPNKYLIASNEGVSIYTPISKKPTRTYLSNFNERSYSVNYDPNTKSIYSGTSSGLKIGNNQKASFYSFKNKPIICKAILYFNEKIYITTKNNGVLIFKNDTIIDQWTGINNSYINSIRFIKSYNDQLFLSTASGIQILDKNGIILNTISKSDGLYSTNIIDFDIINDVLWLVSQKGVQPINIKDIKPTKFQPKISFTRILVNDSITNNSTFNYDQNKFEFIVSAKNIRFSNEIRYQYILEGLDREWQINKYYENKIKYKSLPPGDYIFKIKSIFRDNESKLISYSFTINAPYWQSWWFYLLVSLSGIIIIAVIAYSRVNTINKRNQQDIKNREMEKNAINSQLKALRAQMNPHFIFNSINSIQDLVLKQETIKSYDYLVVFSKLVRNTLDFSEREFISLKEEVAFLEVYLSLEKLRFKDDFKYIIECKTDKNILIPSLIIQPFIENAIKHGLLHKDGHKKLTVKFTVNEHLICEIIDNGVGRVEAEAIKKAQNRDYESFSTEAIKQRMNMLSAQYITPIHYQTIDLINDKGAAIGTKVVVTLPFNVGFAVH